MCKVMVRRGLGMAGRKKDLGLGSGRFACYVRLRG